MMRSAIGSPAPAVGAGAPLFDPAAHLRMVPYTSAVGMCWQGVKDGVVEVRLPFSKAVQDGASGAIDERAIMALLDHASSSAVFAQLRAALPIATLDLRVAFQRPAPPGTDVVVSAVATHVAETVAFVNASARAGDGAALAVSSATFIIGSSPGGERDGGAAGLRKPAREFNLGDTALLGSFEQYLGLARHGLHVRMEFADRLVGAVSLPALHGGVVAALLVSAARTAAMAEPGEVKRLAAITVQYLRAARAEATSAIGTFVKRGARSAVLSVTARQAHGSREVAHAQCIFVTPDDGVAR
jgi:uncharacterized protein (TIGR00369 family)